MRLNVHHRTVYRFESPRSAVLQSHRLTPSDFAGQKVIDWTIATPEAAVCGARFRDGAGDVTGTMRLAGPITEMAIELRGTVETTDLAGVLRGHREKVPPRAYVRPTRVTRPDMAIADLAAAALAEAGPNGPLPAAHALSGAVTAALGFAAGSTSAQSTAAEAMSGGQGVCQDFAHVLIAAAISQEIPARYVAGYLFPGEDNADGQAQTAASAPGPMGTENQASHAWAELFIDGLGWVGFDPSNACCPDARYIRLCSGYDAFDAAPIRGLAAGTGAETLDVDVAITQEQQ